MKQRDIQLLIIALFINITLSAAAQRENFNGGWLFHLTPNVEVEINASEVDFDDSQWSRVSLPHNAHNEPYLVNDQWQGLCWYRKYFDLEELSSERSYLLEFEAAMNHTTIWINGMQVKVDQGGYLPIVFDATPYLKPENNLIAIRLDNRDNEVTGPKPLKLLDFNMYCGLYRNAWLITQNKSHITHPILANRVASGGIFITYPDVSEELSVVKIQSHVANDEAREKRLKVVYNIYDGEELVKSVTTEEREILQYGNAEFVECINMERAKLWSPTHPNLYRVDVMLYEGDLCLDKESTRFGIREVTFVDNQIHINGEKSFLRGVNRHQEYPFIGYALSDNAQYRDAKKIKDAGFDYIRLSHYPQSPAFMDACDELGLFVTNAILGWQYYSESYAFKNQCYESTRELIRRDRNHPSVLSWEVSLNETNMPVSFMQELHNIAHEEYPGAGLYTCGWMPEIYDIYLQARQHRIMKPNEVTFEKPYMVSEYGDWEYYSTNPGLNQHKFTPEKRVEYSSRQLRSSGEKGLLQQAYNLQEAHNDNMNIPATGDSFWVMFDYNSGCHKEIDSSGTMDLCRLPKFAYYLYQSQSDNIPMVKIASYWSPESDRDIRVFSNCEEVKLYLNNKLIATQSPDSGDICNNLPHPPFTFKLDQFKAGELRAEGYTNGKKVVTDIVKTPQKVRALKCWIDESGIAPEAGCNDVVFLYIAAVDRNGTICHDFIDPIDLQTDTKVEILNTDGITTEAGIAPVLLRIGDQQGETTIRAISKGGIKGEFNFTIK